MNIKLGHWAVICGMGLAVSGCIHHQETVYQDVARTPVDFESDKAARMFYEALSKAPASQRPESKTEVSLPIVFGHERRVISGNNAAFNNAVAKCDTNQDGKITELEAAIYAEHQKK